MTKKVVTNDGKNGGWLVGKRHYDKNGKSLGGIKAVVTDAGNKPVELEGGEVIINREASKKYWKELSRINQSAGNGVAIEPPSDAFDEDPAEDYENGGKIEFNANHIPNKWILNYAIKIKEEHPDVWALGGNIFGNQAFINLKRVAERGHWLDSEEWMYKKWRSFVARHKGDFRIQGVIAMLKWVDKVDKGWQYMKNLIEEEIKKREARKSKKMNNGGNVENKGIFHNLKKKIARGVLDDSYDLVKSKTDKRAISRTEKIIRDRYNNGGNVDTYNKGDVWRINSVDYYFDESYIDDNGIKKWKTYKVFSTPRDRYSGTKSIILSKTITDKRLKEFADVGKKYGMDVTDLFVIKYNDGGNLSKTPAPLSERIKGSKFNASGSAKDSTSGEDIKFDDKTIASIQSLIDSHNEKYPSKKITLGVAKAVVRRGMGAYSSSHRPTITDGKPNSRTAWGLARLKAFIHKAEKGKSKSGKYSQDNDLFDDLDITVSKFDKGGSIELEKGIKAEYEHAKTIAQFKREGVSVRDVARSIAEDHIKEDPHYYSKLEKMEGKKFATGGLVTTYGGTANIGDKGQLSTRKGRINIQITNITDKWVIFNDLDEGGKRKDTPRDKFIENYKGNAQLASSVQSQKSSAQTSGEWRVKTFDELKAQGLLDKSDTYRGITNYMINIWAGRNVKEINKDVLKYLDSGSNSSFAFDGYSVKSNLFTKDPLPTTAQSNVAHELSNYRIKTEKELLKEFGKNFRVESGFSTNKSMDWLFGKKITEIVLPSDYDDVLQKVKNNKRFSSDSSFDTDKTSWNIFNDMYMFDPALYSQNVNANLGQTQQKDLRPSTDSDVWDAAFKVGDVVYIRKDIADFVGIDFDSDDNVFVIITEKFEPTAKSPKNKTGILYKIVQVKINNYANGRIFQLEGKDIALVDSNQTKPNFNITEEDFQEIVKGTKDIDKEREEIETTSQKGAVETYDDIKALEDEYNDLLFLIDLTPTTDVDNMLALKLQAKQLKDKIDLLHLHLKKKVTGELELLDNLFNASSVQPQERYKFNAYNDGFAPDGQPTSLPKNLYDWTMTEEFQNWFGNFTNAYNYRNSSYENVPCSVVVNKNYEPLVVYHGTGVQFSFFKFDKFPAMYFAENEAYSNWFAEMKGQQSGTIGYVYPFFLNIRTPLDLTIYGIEPVSPDDFIDWMFLQTGLDADELKISKALLDPTQKFQAWMYLRNSPEMLNVLRDKAICDGIIYYEDNPSVDKTSDAYQTKAYIVFNSNSAKIADPNREMMTIPAMRSFYLKRGGKL